MLGVLLLAACGSAPDPHADLRALDRLLVDEVARLRQAEEALDLALPQAPPPADPKARAQGVTLAHGLQALSVVDAHLVHAPDWGPAVRAAEEALVAGGFGEPPPGAAIELAGAAERLSAWTSRAPDPGSAVLTFVEGAIGALDRHARVAWPAEVSGWEVHHAGAYVGVGLELADVDGDVAVRWPVPGSPAFDAGLHQGDRIDAVDDRPAEGLGAASVAGLLRGDAGTSVRLTVSRSGEPRIFELVRRPVVAETVTGWARLPDNGWDIWLDRDAGVAYARILAFRPHTDEALDRLLEPWLDEISGLVLDLRSCPGGDLDAAAQIADRFVDDGLVVQLEGRAPPPPPPEGVVAWNQAVPGHALEDVDVVVLVDAQTASSAEVVAGALQDLADAVVIGAPTVGKGSSQALHPLPELSMAVQVTNLRWTLPGGRSLDGVGITPDISLPLGLAGDYQVDLQRRHRAHLRSHADGTPIVPDLPVPREDLPVLSADPHVVRAMLHLAERRR